MTNTKEPTEEEMAAEERAIAKQLQQVDRQVKEVTEELDALAERKLLPAYCCIIEQWVNDLDDVDYVDGYNGSCQTFFRVRQGPWEVEVEITAARNTIGDIEPYDYTYTACMYAWEEKDSKAIRLAFDELDDMLSKISTSRMSEAFKREVMKLINERQYIVQKVRN